MRPCRRWPCPQLVFCIYSKYIGYILDILGYLWIYFLVSFLVYSRETLGPLKRPGCYSWWFPTVSVHFDNVVHLDLKNHATTCSFGRTFPGVRWQVMADTVNLEIEYEILQVIENIVWNTVHAHRKQATNPDPIKNRSELDCTQGVLLPWLITTKTRVPVCDRHHKAQVRQNQCQWEPPRE